MKRQAKRIHRTLSPEKQAELKRVRDRILKDERAELSAKARQALKEYELAQTELVRVAELLKAERHSQGLSLADLQKKTGISRAALCRLENLVDANPTVATLERIAQAMGKRLFVGLGE